MTWRQSHPKPSPTRSCHAIHRDYPTLYHATTRPAMYSILKEGFDTSLMGKSTFRKSSGAFGSPELNFGEGVYFSKTYDNETYGNYVLAITLKPEARIFHAVSMVDSKPSYWDDILQYEFEKACPAYRAAFLERTGHEYTRADSDAAAAKELEPWSDYNKNKWVPNVNPYIRTVNQYARDKGYDGIDWESEILLWKPASIESIKKAAKP